ncbi:MAG: septum formation initiator family protein [Rubellimicrobium sp.]|nr:septum formation initiator family protein [Rubellimicrobium sp.]
MIRRRGTSLGTWLVLGLLLLGSGYFLVAAIMGPYGVFRQAEINAEAEVLRDELAVLEAEVARMDNLTRRLSDEYLDLDLLDERARDMLGYLRPDEIVIR